VLGKNCGQILQALYSSGEPLCSALCEGKSCMAIGEKWSMAACRVRHKNGNMIPAGFSTLVVPEDARDPADGDAVAVIFIRAPDTGASEGRPSQPLRIFSLGHFALAVTGAGLDVDNWRRKQAATLLKILISHVGRPVHRDRLMEWLWPDTDPDRGWERLKVTVSFLRGKLRTENNENDVIETVGKSYLLRREAIWLDSDIFITLVSDGWDRLRDGNMQEALTHFEEARGLCRGDYLEDEPYADWCAEERERLREIHLEMLAGLAQCYGEQQRYSEAAQVCRTALFRDPCRENFIRCLLENLVAVGRPDWAESQFRTWRRELSEEYGLEPTHETLQLHDRILKMRDSA
jgi:DNA-binding SARP family transcriptional activator